MCTSCNAAFTIFSVKILTKEPVDTNVELYKEIAHRLFQNKVASNLHVGKNKAYMADEKQLFGFELHLANTNNPHAVTLENVKSALNGILGSFEGYDELKIEHA